MRTRRLSVVALVILLVAVGAGVALSRVERGTPTLPTALASMPAETLTASVTDWARVRALLGSDDGPGGAGAAGLLDRAYETDVSAVSVLGDRVPVMERSYGWSVLDAEWEALAQSRQGAAVIVQMPPYYDLGTVREGLGELGYPEPFESDGVWRGGADLVAGVDSSLTPLMGHAVVLDDSNRVVFSDRAAYARRTARVIGGSVGALAQTTAVSAVAEAMSGAVAGVVHTGGRGCEVMGFGGASGADRALAQQRVSAVGGLAPYAALGLAVVPGADGRLSRPPLTVAMHFDDTGAAVGEEAQRRAALAVGEAPGQGGTYGSRFAVSSAQQRGGDVVLRLRPRDVDAQLLSDLNTGELLFAGC